MGEGGRGKDLEEEAAEVELSEIQEGEEQSQERCD